MGSGSAKIKDQPSANQLVFKVLRFGSGLVQITYLRQPLKSLIEVHALKKMLP